MTFPTSRRLFLHSSKLPPMSRIGGKLLWEKAREGTLFFLGHIHLEFFSRCHQGKILSRGELWGKVHTVDYVAETKGSRCAWADESVPYPSHKVGYQRFRETFGAEVPQFSTHINFGGMEFLDISSLGMAYRYAAKIEQKFKQKKWEFGSVNQKKGKVSPKQ